MGASASTISTERILHEMSDLWVSLAKQGEGDAGVLRACSMTLIVAAEESDDPQSIGETLAALMPDHPSRAIVIRFRAGEERALSSRVFAQCWMPFGHRRQICCEQIEIMASDASLPDLAAVLMPLKVPDLPVIIWCRSERLFRLRSFSQLLSIAQKLIVDSTAFGDQAAALNEIKAVVGGKCAIGDLSWTRLTRWRELIAQLFENRAQLANLPHVSEIVISHRAAKPPTTARYMAAWLVDGLSKIGANAHVEFRSEGGEPGWRLALVELRAAGNAEPIASISRGEGQPAEVHVGGLQSKTLLPQLNDCELMREELSIPGRDPYFERALAAAAELAVS